MKLVLAFATLACPCLALILTPLANGQTAGKIACPDSIQVANAKLLNPVKGWNATSDPVPHHLKRVVLFDGPPQERASLVPDRETKTKLGNTAVWLLADKPPRSYYIGCYYSSTTVVLSRELPAGLTQCTVLYSSSEQVEGMAAVKKISCK